MPKTTTEVRFYHLEQVSVEDALHALLEKTLAAGERAIVRCCSALRADELTDYLWKYDNESWLPHGAKADGFSADQPIWLTDQVHVPNGARFLFLIDSQDWPIDGAVPKSQFSRILDLFDGTDGAAVASARERWKAAKLERLLLSYWQQSPEGVWSKKA